MAKQPTAATFRVATALLFALSLHAQAPGTITNRAIPTDGITDIDAQLNTYVASGGFTGPTVCAPLNITKFDPLGHLLFSFDAPETCGVHSGFRNIAVDASGALFATGTVDSYSGTSLVTRAFAAKLTPDGSGFAYFAYFPAALATPNAIRFDSAGNAYVAGATSDSHPFLVKISRDGGTFPYTVQFPDSGVASALVLDAAGNVFLTGQSGANALVAKLDPAGKITRSTSFGGVGGANGQAIALDSTANIYIAGDAGSGFPTTPGTYQPTAVVPLWSNGPTAFIAKLEPDGTAIMWATYTVANGNYSGVVPSPIGFAVAASGDTYIARGTGAGFIPTASAPQPCFGMANDIVMLHLNPQGTLGDATFLGRTGAQVTGMLLPGDGSVVLSSYGDGGAMISQVRFGEPGWTAAACLSPDVLNSASFSSDYQRNVSPGELVSLTGFGIGPDTGVAAQLDSDSQLPRTLAGVQVFFNGIAAPLLYVQSRQVNAQVPFEVNGSIFVTPPVAVTLTYGGHTFGPYMMDSDWYGPPGIFRLHPGISTQAAALNEDGTVNGSDNPAARGSTITFFGTGNGPLVPPCPTGGLNPNAAVPLFFTGTPIQLPVQYGGAAPSLLCGVDQFNVEIPLSAQPGLFPLGYSPGYEATIYIK
ncbi:MAG: hypothetical protein ABI693_31345 [Bryobacteraceae bacterium]